jgi:signal-induced proliferation-associated 1 like protein 1
VLFPNVDLSNLRKVKEISEDTCKQELLRFEQGKIRNTYKFGILYCAKGQTTELEMFANEKGSADLDDFLEMLGDRVELSGWKGEETGKFTGGLTQCKNFFF